MSTSTNLTSAQIGLVSAAFNQFNAATTGSTHPGLWVVGNLSTIQYCSTYGGAAKVISPFPISVTSDHYYCQTPDKNTTALESTIQLMENRGVPHVLVQAASSSAGERRAKLTSWLGLGFASVSVLAWTVSYL